VLATAHDMGREHRIIAALAPTDVPVPPVVGLSADDSVNGAPFYVMDFVEGTVVRDLPSTERFTAEQRARAGTSLVDVLARIHDVDIDAVGLGDLGRREGYLERQLKRWSGQFDKSRTRDVPVMDEVLAELRANVPDQVGATIVHGDYRLDNCMLADDGSVAAVLDWELCTLGDPLADLGLLMVYWADRGEENPAAITPATAVEGFPTKAELLAAYAERSGRDVSGIDYYVAFGYWKLACILEGVYARYAGGSMGDQGGGHELFGDLVVQLAEQARAALSGAATTGGS
jgi:aminoglycoside phosphotransferase (APT) family kinase protein